MPSALGRFPRWIHPVFGLGLVILGSILAVHSSASVQLFIVLASAGLMAIGITRILEAAEHDAPWRASVWLNMSSGALLAGAGLTALIWRGATLPVLALGVAIVLLISGAASLFTVFKTSGTGRLTALLSGLAALATGGLVLFWPKLTLWAFGVFIGGWLVFAGLRLVIEFLTSGGKRSVGGESAGGGEGARGGKLAWFGKLAGSALALLLAAAMVLVTSFVHAGDPRLVADSFYTPPGSVPGDPGQLLRSERLTSGIPDGATAWRILYTTTNPDGSPAVASGSVVVPDGAVGAGGEPLPVVSVAHGTKGIVPRCAPSLSAKPYSDGPAAALEALVAEGWAGVMTDYVGLGTQGPHPYLVGQAEGRNVLDAFRAARQLPELSLRDDTLIWGHSQGGHGALWSAAIAREYAPEVGILGVAALAPATDLVALAQGVKDAAAGKVVSAYIAAAWDEVFQELDVAGQLTPGYAPAVQRIGELCFDGRDALAGVIGSTQLFEPIFPDAAINGPLGDKLRENSVDMNVGYPLFVAQGQADSLVLPDMQREWVRERCAAGQPMDYREYAGRDHMPLVEADSPLIGDLVDWANDRLAGRASVDNCR